MTTVMGWRVVEEIHKNSFNYAGNTRATTLFQVHLDNICDGTGVVALLKSQVFAYIFNSITLASPSFGHAGGCNYHHQT
jgi:hypothetical protein